MQKYVPVVYEGKSLMPTKPARAGKWIKSGKATPFWNKGVFCIRLNFEPSGYVLQPITVGIDPGSKVEGFTVKSKSHTYLNLHVEAVKHVKDRIETRRMMRRSRRHRKTPYRSCRFNRSIGGIPPSTKARWAWKLRIVNWLRKMFPIDSFVVEDIKARTLGKKKWDKSFSPLEVGKTWFYDQLKKLGRLELKQGWETKKLRDVLGLKKISNKLKKHFNAHCVDSWVLANCLVGGHSEPDNMSLLFITPFKFLRRQLQDLKPGRGNKRRRKGGTTCLGFKRGSIVKHVKYGITYIAGWQETISGNRLRLKNIGTGEDVSRHIKPEDIKFLCYSSWRFSHV
jgi:hypothetical protein